MLLMFHALGYMGWGWFVDLRFSSYKQRELCFLWPCAARDHPLFGAPQHGKSVIVFMDRGSRITLMFVLCIVKSTPLKFVVNEGKAVLNALMHTVVGTVLCA